MVPIPPTRSVQGPTVNLASRLESSGMPGEVQVSTATRDLIAARIPCTFRASLDLKGAGAHDVHLVEKGRVPLTQSPGNLGAMGLPGAPPLKGLRDGGTHVHWCKNTCKHAHLHTHTQAYTHMQMLTNTHLRTHARATHAHLHPRTTPPNTTQHTHVAKGTSCLTHPPSANGHSA